MATVVLATHVPAALDLKGEVQKLTDDLTAIYQKLDDAGLSPDEAAQVQGQCLGMEVVLDRVWEMLEAPTLSLEQVEAVLTETEQARARLWSKYLVADQTAALLVKRYRKRINKVVQAARRAS